MTEQQDELKSVQDHWQKLSEKMQEVGKQMNVVGKNIKVSVTNPIVDAGTAMFNFAKDQEVAFAQVSTVLEGSSAYYDKYKKDIRAASSELGISFEEYAKSVSGSISAGQAQGDAIEFTRRAVMLAGGGFTETANAVDVMTTALNAYGLESKEASNISDMLIMIQNKGKTTVDELSSSMGKVIPIAQAQGIGFDQLGAAYTALTKNGVATEEVGTGLKAMFSELGEAGSKVDKILRKETGKSFSELSAEGKNTGEVLAILQKEADKSGLQLSDLFGSVQAGGVALKLAKNGGQDFQEFLGDMQNSAGATEIAFNKMGDTTKDKMAIAWTTIENTLASFGDIMLPVVASIAESFGKLVGKFEGLDESTKKIILVFAGIAAAIGPILVVFGSVASAVGTISGTIAVVTTGAAAATPAIGALATAFTVLTGPIGIAVAVIAGLSIGTIALVKHLSKDALPAVDRFGDSLEGVSDSTKVALDGFFELSDGVSQSLSEMHMTSSRVTQEMATDLVAKYDGMNKQIVEGLNTKHSQEMESMKDFFLNSSVLTDEEEAKILEKKQKTHDKEIESEEYKKQRVAEILQQAADENRALTEREHEVINNINQQAQNQAVKVLSASEMEQKIIMERLKETASIASAQQAAEVVRNSAKQRDESVKEVNAQYDETVAQIIRMRDESGDISAEQADKLIAEAKKQRDQSVMYAENMHQDIVAEAKKQAGEHVDEIDWETGEILSKWAVFKNNTKTKFQEIGNDISTAWNETNKFLKDKASETVDKVVDNFVKFHVSIGEKIYEAKSKIEKIWGEVLTFLTSIDLKQIGKDIIQGLIDGIGSKATAVWGEVTSVVDGIKGAIIGKKGLDSHSPSRVTYQYGEWAGEGLEGGIEAKIKAVANAGKKLATAVVQPMDDFAGPYAGKNRIMQSMSQQSSTQEKNITVHQENHFHSLKSSPSEDARLQKRAMNEAALAWR